MFRYREYLECVLREGSFSRAAAKLHISQPALSAAIKKAELQYGYLIFDRSSQPVSLTEFGQLYFDSMHQVCSMEEELRDRASNMAALSVGEITIGTNHVYASLLFPELLGQFHNKYPNIHLRLLEGAASANKTQLLSAETDLILDCGKLDADASAITCVPIDSELLLLAAPRTLLAGFVPPEQILTAEDICAGKCRDAQCPAISVGQVAAGDFIFLTPGNDTRFGKSSCFWRPVSSRISGSKSSRWRQPSCCWRKTGCFLSSVKRSYSGAQKGPVLHTAKSDLHILHATSSLPMQKSAMSVKSFRHSLTLPERICPAQPNSRTGPDTPFSCKKPRAACRGAWARFSCYSS